MENSKKKKLRTMCEDVLGDIENEINNNQFEPSERGTGTMTREETSEDCVNGLEVFALEVLEMFGIKETMKDKTFDEILKEIDSTPPDEFDELKFLETKRDSEREPKYTYVMNYYLHTKENRIIETTMQTYKGEESGNLEAQEVEKKEVITYEYQ